MAAHKPMKDVIGVLIFVLGILAAVYFIACPAFSPESSNSLPPEGVGSVGDEN